MKSHIVNCIDLELNDFEVIEVGLTTVDMHEREILQSYSFPVKPILPIKEDIVKLTGWSTAKLEKIGEPIYAVYLRFLNKYGLVGRLMVTDIENEWMSVIANIDQEYMCFDEGGWAKPCDTMNVSSLYKIKHKDFLKNRSLDFMLSMEGLEFEGRRHRAKDDSYNIARLFLSLTRSKEHYWEHTD